MEHDFEQHTGINFGRIAVLGFLIAFPGIRKALGIICLLGLIIAGLLFVVGRANPPGIPVVTSTPVCDRVAIGFSSYGFDVIQSWGRWFRTKDNKETYIKEAHGPGYCMIRRQNIIEQSGPRSGLPSAYDRWYEVPSKYSNEIIQQLPPPMNPNYVFAAIVAGLSGLFLIGLWLPATILAAISLRFLRMARYDA